MKSCGAAVALVFVSVLHASCAGSQAGTAVAAEKVARTWLEVHSHSAQPDELDALKSENPSAYALVKALLTKRSLGLLNPRHPTASFAPEKPTDDAEQPSGPAAFANIVSPGELNQARTADEVAADVPAVYAEAPKPEHHDWLNWKPTASAADSDEAMVQNVLGAVAQLKGGNTGNLLKSRGSSQGTTPTSGLEADDNMFDKDVAPSVPVTPKERPTIAMPAVAQQATQGNSYLKDIDFSADLPKAAASPSARNALDSFSWADNKPTESVAQEAQVVRKAPVNKSALSDYLR